MRAVTEARLWLGTPYVARASCRGAGCDCLGLVRGVWRGLYGPEPWRLPPYPHDWAEVGDWDVRAALAQYLPAKSLAEGGAGDVVVFRIRHGGGAKHLGIEGEAGVSVIHAMSGHGVVETPWTPSWRRRVLARFGWP